MKRSIAHPSRTRPGVTRLMPLAFALSLLASPAGGLIEPSGKKVGVVQFDAILERNETSGPPHSLMFARYWVSPEFYTVAVVWLEPHGHGYWDLRTLAVTSGKDAFRVADDLYPVFSQTYPKPLADRGVFRFAFGDYDTSHVRFAEREALARRVYAGDLKALDDPNQRAGQVVDVPVLTPEGSLKRELARIKVQANGRSIDSMDLFNADPCLLGSMRYEYDREADATHLRRLTAILPERPIAVGLHGEGMTVTLDTGTGNGSQTYQVRDMQATHHKGSRTCTVEYQSVSLGGKAVRVPGSVKVQNGKNNQIMRSARLTGFRLVGLDAEGAWRAARQFAGLTAQYGSYLDLRFRYWEKDSTDVDPNDLGQARHLLAYLEKEIATPGCSVGERLKYLSGLIELDRLVGDYDALERHYQGYLRTLSDNELYRMVLAGGYEPIDRIVSWGRYAKADRLLHQWVETAVAHNEAEGVLRFSRYGLQNGQLWTTARLLERFLEKGGLSGEDRFEAQVLRCAAIHQLDRRLGDLDGVEEPQSQWVLFSTTRPDLQRILGPALDEAVRSFRGLPAATQAEAQQPYVKDPPARHRHGLPDPSPVQEAKALLDRIFRERNVPMNGVLVGPQTDPRQGRQLAPSRPVQPRNVVPRRRGQPTR